MKILGWQNLELGARAVIAALGATRGMHARTWRALAGVKTQAAFSLVEVTLAIGVVAIAIIPVFGLIPTGLNTFHKAIDASVGSQIAQRLIVEAQQTDFATLIGANSSRFVQTVNNSTLRYFDDQGTELTGASISSAIYRTQVVVVPNTQTPGPQPSNVNLATVTVQVANNPRKAQLTSDGTTLLWSPFNSSNVPVATYYAIVANNQ